MIWLNFVQQKLIDLRKVIELVILLIRCELNLFVARNNIISWEEFCIHQKRDDFWIIIDNGIYDITKWITCYPGTNQCPHPGSKALNICILIF